MQGILCFFTKLSAKVYRGGKALINLFRQNKNIENVAVKNMDTCGLALKTLETDTVQIAKNAKQLSSTVATAPAVFEGSQVSMHHSLHGINIGIRDAYDTVVNNKNLANAELNLLRMLKVDKEFAVLPPLEKNCIAWRGRSEHFLKYLNTDFEIIKNAKVGDTITPDIGYSYLGFTRELAEVWANPVEGKSIMYKILLPKGAKVSRNLEHGGEIVMPRKAEYKVLSKSINGNRTEVELEYILPQKDNVSEIEELLKTIK